MEGKGSRDKLNQKYLIRPQVNIVFSIHLNLLQSIFILNKIMTLWLKMFPTWEIN